MEHFSLKVKALFQSDPVDCSLKGSLSLGLNNFYFLNFDQDIVNQMQINKKISISLVHKDPLIFFNILFVAKHQKISKH